VNEMGVMLSYFGGKLRLSQRGIYPAPEHDVIVDAFAGGAGYPLAYRHPRVILIERNPIVCAVWRYLIDARESEIIALPDLESGQTVDDVPGLSQESRWLIGFHVSQGVTHPRKQASKRVRDRPGSYWGPRTRLRIAQQLSVIRQWIVHEGTYADADSFVHEPATWFVDPPYHASGHHYRFNAGRGDDAAQWYTDLADWCRSRVGLTITCEQAGATWLPFAPVAEFSRAGNRGAQQAKEVAWVQRNDPR
jgi:site-specific DNA-adenine methylase